MGLNISPTIWQSYINAILDCFQSRKYLFPLKNNTCSKTRRLIESVMEKWTEDIPM